MNKRTLCPALWTHIHVVNDGRAFPCCMTPITDENSLGNVNDQSLLEIMNSPKAKEMRVNMVNGVDLPQSCHRCTEKEKLGMSSYRAGFVDRYSDIAESQYMHSDGTLNEIQLKLWDFRFSNYCNLSCRTCAPLFSTSWDRDHKLIWGITDKSSPLINLENASKFWKELEEQLPYVETIHFAGGEPLLMTEHWRLIDMLIEKKLTDVELKYSTNCTTLMYKGRNIIDLWKQFKAVHLSLSVDGAYNTFEYVRNRGVWADVEKNLIDIRDSNVDFWIHPTVSILNIYRLPELHDKMLEMKMVDTTDPNYFTTQFHINPLFQPDSYSLPSLPAHHKKAVEKMLLDYADIMYKKYQISKDGWLAIINFMNRENTEYKWKKFVEATKQLDSIRNQNFLDINPEFIDDFNTND